MKHVILYVGHLYKLFWIKKIWPGWQGGSINVKIWPRMGLAIIYLWPRSLLEAPKWVKDPGNGLKSIRGSWGDHLGSISGFLDPFSRVKSKQMDFAQSWTILNFLRLLFWFCILDGWLLLCPSFVFQDRPWSYVFLSSINLKTFRRTGISATLHISKNKCYWRSI